MGVSRAGVLVIYLPQPVAQIEFYSFAQSALALGFGVLVAAWVLVALVGLRK